MPSPTVPAGPSAPHVVVIGAGILGASLSYALLRRGARVTVIDREGPASFTSGMAFAWIENQGYFRNGDGMNTDLAREYFILHRMGMLAWRQLSAEIGPRLGVLWNGAVQYSPTGSDDAKLLHADLDRRQRWGSPSHPIGAAQVRGLIPGIQVDDDIDAFTTLDEGHVDPAVGCTVLMDEVRALGANVIYDREATGVDATDGAVSAVQTTQGAIACDHVVYAVGINAPKLVTDLGINAPLEPSQGVLVHLRPMKRVLDPVLITADLHILQRFDGRVVMAKHYSGTPVSDPEGLEASILFDRAKRLLPGLTGGSIERVTTGERVVPIDGLPIIGHSDHITGAHSLTTNSGITLGPVLGNLMADEILTGARSELLDPYRSTRFA